MLIFSLFVGRGFNKRKYLRFSPQVPTARLFVWTSVVRELHIIRGILSLLEFEVVSWNFIYYRGRGNEMCTVKVLTNEGTCYFSVTF